MIKPCPVCGKNKIMIGRIDNRKLFRYFLYCDFCGCAGKERPLLFLAKRAWNKRKVTKHPVIKPIDPNAESIWVDLD